MATQWWQYLLGVPHELAHLPTVRNMLPLLDPADQNVGKNTADAVQAQAVELTSYRVMGKHLSRPDCIGSEPCRRC